MLECQKVSLDICTKIKVIFRKKLERHTRVPGAKEVFKLKNASVVMGKIFLGIPHGGPETLQAAVLLEPDPDQGSRKEHTVPTQDHCGFTKDHTEGKVERGRVA